MRILSFSPAPIWDVEDRKGMPSIYLGQRGFVDAGHHVLWVVPGRENRSYDYDGIQIHEFRLRFPIAPSRHIWLHRLSIKIHSLLFVVIATVKGLHLSKTFQPDVVYGHFLYGAPVAWIIGRIRRIPNITRMYGTFLFPWVHSLWGRIRKFDEVLAFTIPCNYLIVTNDGTRGADCAVALGVPKERLRFWRNGVYKEMYDPCFDKAAFKDSLHIPRCHKVLLSVGRLVGWKRVDRLIRIMPAVLSQYPDATAIIVGDGEERDNLEDLCRELRVQDHVRFVGLITHDEASRFFNGADIFVSLYELSNAGNPLLEALCCGKCIVSLNNGGTGEINQHGQVGILLEESELHLLAEVLIDLLRDDERRDALAQAARNYAVKHLQSWPERIQMEVDLIESLGGAANGSQHGLERELLDIQRIPGNPA